MNYIREIRAFYDWLGVNPLPPGSIALWHALMHVNNKAGWKSEFTVANMMLQSLTGLSRQGLDRARNDLIQRGLIEYTKGRGNRAGKYKVKSVCNIIGTPVDTVIDTMRTQTDTQSGHTSSTLDKLNENETKQEKKEKEDDLAEQVNQIIEYYNIVFKGVYQHRKNNQTIKNKVKTRLKRGFTVQDICLAIKNIRASAFHCGDNENGKVYATLDFICRNDQKVEEWMNYNPENSKQKEGGLTYGGGKYRHLYATGGS